MHLKYIIQEILTKLRLPFIRLDQQGKQSYILQTYYSPTMKFHFRERKITQFRVKEQAVLE